MNWKLAHITKLLTHPSIKKNSIVLLPHDSILTETSFIQCGTQFNASKLDSCVKFTRNEIRRTNGSNFSPDQNWKSKFDLKMNFLKISSGQFFFSSVISNYFSLSLFVCISYVSSHILSSLLPTRSIFLLWLFLSSCTIIIRVFHSSIIWWILTEIWVTASLLKSPWLFSIFYPILML